jgi:hypothetical protein
MGLVDIKLRLALILAAERRISVLKHRASLISSAPPRQTLMMQDTLLR